MIYIGRSKTANRLSNRSMRTDRGKTILLCSRNSSYWELFLVFYLFVALGFVTM